MTQILEGKAIEIISTLYKIFPIEELTYRNIIHLAFKNDLINVLEYDTCIEFMDIYYPSGDDSQVKFIIRNDPTNKIKNR